MTGRRQYQSIDKIEEYLRSNGEIPSSTSPEPVASPAKQPPSVHNTPLSLEEEVKEVERRKKSNLFVNDKDSFDVETAREKIPLLEKLRQIEALSLSLVVEDMKKGQEAGHMITHASDSTTKRGVGQFIGQVSHLITTIFIHPPTAGSPL